MKKEIGIAVIILVGFLSLLFLERPIREFLSLFILDEQITRQVSSITIRLFLIAIILVIIRKLHLLHYTGLNNWKHCKNIQSIVIALSFIMMGVVSNWNTYTEASFELLILFALSTIIIGLVEELVFRGAIFPLFIKSFIKLKHPLLLGAILSSLMFGLLHFVNLLGQPDNIIGITSQVFFATSIGVFFCGLMVRTENILIPSFIHALVNFGFGADDIKQSIEVVADVEKAAGINWNSVIPTTLFFSFIFVGGVYMLLKSDSKIILEKLEKPNQ